MPFISRRSAAVVVVLDVQHRSRLILGAETWTSTLDLRNTTLHIFTPNRMIQPRFRRKYNNAVLENYLLLVDFVDFASWLVVSAESGRWSVRTAIYVSACPLGCQSV